MRRNDHDVTDSVQTTDPAAVGAEVVRLSRSLFNGARVPELERAFSDAAAMYAGAHPEYCACDTGYHDIQHVLDVTLAMARLIEGYQRSRRNGDEAMTREVFIAGILAALFHDFGYLRRRNDRRHRYGAEYTLTHVSRSAAFLRRYVRDLGLQLARAYECAARYSGGANLYLDEMKKNIRYAEVVAQGPASGMLRRRPPRTLPADVEPYPRDLISL